MIQEEKLKKVCDNYSLLNEEQQNYILGIINALLFANSTYIQTEYEGSEIAPHNR